MKSFFRLFVLLVGSLSSSAQNLIVSNDTTICLGGTATLSATPSGGGYGTDSYTFQLYPYSPEPYGGGTGIIFGSNGDDQIAGPFPLGFTFCFFNQNFTQFWVGSNGWIGFTYNPAWTTYTATTIPNTGGQVPKNCIMAPWQDWYPGNGGSFEPPYVFYYTTGVAPNRKLVVYWFQCPMYACLTTRGSFQIVLNEQNSIIENHLTNKPFCTWQGNAATQGVHNANGTVAFTATNRNCTSWTTSDESTRFVPSGVKWYVGGYPGGTIVGYGQLLVISPAVTTIYTAVVETCGGGTATADVTVTVMDADFSYPGSAWCPVPPNPVPAWLQPGGVFSATPAGLVFVSTLTGEINLAASAPGTYTVTRTITTPCTVSASHPVTVYATPPAPIPASSPVYRCGPGPVTVSVIQQPQEIYYWYDAPAGGTQYPGPGPSLTTSIGSTTTFYAEAVNTVTSCVSAGRTPLVAEVRPIPVITNDPTTSQICSGNATGIVLQSSLPGSVFSWAATGSSPQVTGYSGGTGPVILQTLVNASLTNQTVTYTVTATADQCQSQPVDFTVTVFPVPDVLCSPASDTLCSGEWTGVTLASAVPGVTFSWTATGTAGISGYSPGSGSLIRQNLFNTVYVPGSVMYTVTPAYGSCIGTQGSAQVVVNPVAQVDLRRCTDSVTTTLGKPFPLKGGTPTGGQYSGPGVNPLTGYFSPGTAGAGNHKILYNYTNLYGCSASDSLWITVQSPAPFSCGNTLRDIRDNKTYPTILIGGQCWMASNLRFGIQVPGSQSQRDNCVNEKYCFNDDPALCALGYVLYQWDELMTYLTVETAQGLCPPGWHVPSEAQWVTLFSNYINNGFAASALKVTGYSGFNALLSGFQANNTGWLYGSTHPVLRSTLFWSSTRQGAGKAWAHGMNLVVADPEYTPSASFYPSLLNNAFSVRCLKD